MNAPDTPRPRAAKLVAGGLTLLAAIATFDPHFENFEYITYGLYAFLPEITAVALLACLLLARRAGLASLLARHWALLGVIAGTVLLVSWSIAEGMAKQTRGARRNDLAVYGERIRRPLYFWVIHRPQAYSSRQFDMFREDMRVRALDAFSQADFARAADYLRAGRRAAGDGAFDFGTTLDYLAARQRYIRNHRARIAALASTSPMAPVRLYLLRAVEQLENGGVRPDPERLRIEQRLRSAMPKADAVLRRCLLEARAAPIGDDERALIILIFQTMGSLPQPSPRVAPATWCGAVRASDAVRQRGAEAIRIEFGDLARSLWGRALEDPAARTFEDESGLIEDVGARDDEPDEGDEDRTTREDGAEDASIGLEEYERTQKSGANPTMTASSAEAVRQTSTIPV